MLIIEGKPASGKTSLMRRLAYEWARGEQKLCYYDLVLYAEFRDICEKEFKTIADLVIEYNNDYYNFFDSNELEDLKQFINSKVYCKEKRILILLDGYDESSLEKQCKQLHEYMTVSALKSPLFFNIVLTTRPGYLGQHRGNEGRFTFADVLGFTTKEQKDKYIFNHFNSLNNNSKENNEAVHRLLQRNDNMNALAETPLFLTFICLVQERIVEGTVLELYCNTIWWLIDRHQKDFPDRDIPLLFEFQRITDKNKFEIIQDHYHQFPQLHSLGKMGLHNLNKDIFDESDCQQFNLKEIIQQVGLLRKDRFHNQWFRLATSYSFSHRTIHEFLAALHFFCSKEELDLSPRNEATPESELNTSKLTQYQSFLLQVALSAGLPILPEKSKIYFEFISYIQVDLTYHAFNTITGLNSKLLNALFSQCKNVLSIRLNSNRELDEQPSSTLTRISGSTIAFNNLLHLHKVFFYKCSLEANSQFSFKNCPALKSVTFNICKLQSSKINFTNLSAIDRVKFEYCTIEANSQLSIEKCPALENMAFRDCEIKRGLTLNIESSTAIDTLEFGSCSIDLETWLSITTDIRNSSVKCLKFTQDCSKYLESVQKCNKIEEIYIVNYWRSTVIYYENNIVQELIKLARNMESLKRIVFDFTNEKGELMENNKDQIERAGQERDRDFTV